MKEESAAYSEHIGEVISVLPAGVTILLPSDQELFVRRTKVGIDPPLGCSIRVAMIPSQSGSLEPSLLEGDLHLAEKFRIASECDDEVFPTELEIDGLAVQSERDVHHFLALALHFGPFYGYNLAALHDSLTGNVPRPLKIIWRNASESRHAIGDEAFFQIVETLQDVADEEATLPIGRRFEFTIA